MKFRSLLVLVILFAGIKSEIHARHHAHEGYRGQIYTTSMPTKTCIIQKGYINQGDR